MPARKTLPQRSLQVAVLALGQQVALAQLLQLLQRVVRAARASATSGLDVVALLVDRLLDLAAHQVAAGGDQAAHCVALAVDRVLDLAQAVLDGVVQLGQVLAGDRRALRPPAA